jgi:hypothetical protein
VNPFFIGIPAFFALIFAGYVLRERSLGRLDTIQAGTLVLELRPHRLRLLKIWGGIIAIFLVLRFSLPQFQNVFFLTFLSISIGVLGFTYWASWRTLRGQEFPLIFGRLYGSSMVLDFLGHSFLLGSMASTVFIYVPT